MAFCGGEELALAVIGAVESKGAGCERGVEGGVGDEGIQFRGWTDSGGLFGWRRCLHLFRRRRGIVSF